MKNGKIGKIGKTMKTSVCFSVRGRCAEMPLPFFIIIKQRNQLNKEIMKTKLKQTIVLLQHLLKTISWATEKTKISFHYLPKIKYL